MESNGAPNKINVSEATAALIKAAGKEYVNFVIWVFTASSFSSCFFSTREWLTPREEKQDVKGKGLMQTYWCEPSNSLHSELSKMGKMSFLND